MIRGDRRKTLDAKKMEETTSMAVCIFCRSIVTFEHIATGPVNSRCICNDCFATELRSTEPQSPDFYRALAAAMTETGHLVVTPLT